MSAGRAHGVHEAHEVLVYWEHRIGGRVGGGGAGGTGTGGGAGSSLRALAGAVGRVHLEPRNTGLAGDAERTRHARRAVAGAARGQLSAGLALGVGDAELGAHGAHVRVVSLAARAVGGGTSRDLALVNARVRNTCGACQAEVIATALRALLQAWKVAVAPREIRVVVADNRRRETAAGAAVGCTRIELHDRHAACLTCTVEHLIAFGNGRGGLGRGSAGRHGADGNGGHNHGGESSLGCGARRGEGVRHCKGERMGPCGRCGEWRKEDLRGKYERRRWSVVKYG